NLYTAAMHARVNGNSSSDFLRGLFNESDGLDLINRLAYVDTKSFLCCNVLEYADRMSMAHALELRAPLTDHRLVELALRIPFSMKYRHGESKWVLKQAMKSLIPKHLVCRLLLEKNNPMASWLNSELRHLPNLLLTRRA